MSIRIVVELPDQAAREFAVAVVEQLDRVDLVGGIAAAVARRLGVSADQPGSAGRHHNGPAEPGGAQ